jgi:signal transduction histidine kinase/ActR/RegA family two-component response regulator
MEGAKAREYLYGDDQEEKLQRAYETLLEQGEWTGELRQHTKDGDTLIVESRWTLVRDSTGVPTSILAINTDITERKQLESQFLRAQRMESIGRLVGGIAHDLGNLLVPILLGVKVLRQRLDADEKIERTLSMIKKSAERGSEMVEQVLAFARGVEGERIALTPGDIVEEVERISTETFPEAIAVEVDVPDTLPQVVGDATQIQQVLMNLCVNARDAMPDGGTLRLSAETRTLGEQDARMNIDAEPGGYVVLTVADTGTGMPDDVLDKIFEPFFSTKGEGEGTGLGLSTAYSIVKSHDGFIDVSSEEGVGTTFRVFLPAAEEDEPASDRKEAAPPRPGAGERVLVVDDEEFVLESAQDTLERVGYRVVTAGGGQAALEVIEEEGGAIDAVVTDLLMPDVDGFAVIERLRTRGETTPIIAASGLADGRTEAALDAGADLFLPKPFTAERLQSALREVLRAEEDGAAAPA